MAETTDKKTQNKKEPKSFEDAMTRLNEIVTALENGTAPLDDSLALYEEGIGLVRYCSEKLDTAEKKIKILGRNSSGEIVEQDFTAPVDREEDTSDS